MAFPFLGILASGGVRALASTVARGGFSAARSRKIANQIKKAADKSRKEGKIPTDTSVYNTLSRQDKLLLSNPKAREGILTTPTRTRPDGTYSLRKGGRGRKKLEQGKDTIPEPKKYEVVPYKDPVATMSPARKAALARERAERLAMNKQQDRIRGAQAMGLLGATSLPLAFMGEGEQQAPQQEVVPQAMAQDPRLLQVINPSYEATSKELLNAAMLRAGLRLAAGGTLREGLDAAASVGNFENKFRTGQEALAAGRRNLGKDATVYVKQNSDGSFEYSGSSEGVSPLLGQFIKTESKTDDEKNIGQGRVITPDILAKFRAVQTNPNITDEELIESLVQRGFVRPVEQVTGGSA